MDTEPKSILTVNHKLNWHCAKFSLSIANEGIDSFYSLLSMQKWNCQKKKTQKENNSWFTRFSWLRLRNSTVRVADILEFQAIFCQTHLMNAFLDKLVLNATSYICFDILCQIHCHGNSERFPTHCQTKWLSSLQPEDIILVHLLSWFRKHDSGYKK